MISNPKLEWEALDAFHERAKVFGGWLVKAYEGVEHAYYSEQGGTWLRDTSQNPQMSITFVPDAKHEWAGVDNG